jgi:sarcosine oxidase
MAVLQPEGGFVLPERCIVAHVAAALELGAEVRAREQTLEWEARGDGVVVRTDRARYEARHLVVTAGAWAANLVPALRGLAVAERQVLAWFQPRQPALFRPDRFPVFNLQLDEGRYYGLPIFGVPGFKVGRFHHFEERAEADAVDRECHPRDEALLRRFVERYFPAADGATMGLATCMFTNSPDEHFIIDRLPDLPRVSVAAGFSGHGYKFCSVVGEIMADLAQRGETRHDIDLFRLARFAA